MICDAESSSSNCSIELEEKNKNSINKNVLEAPPNSVEHSTEYPDYDGMEESGSRTLNSYEDDFLNCQTHDGRIQLRSIDFHINKTRDLLARLLR